MRVRLFGGVRVDGLHPAALGTRKARTLVGALAVAGGAPVAVDRLVDAVWAGRPPDRSADQLGVLVSRLRRVLGADRIRRVGPAFALEADWTDLGELHRQADEAEEALAARSPGRASERARAALALAAGELLLGEPGEWAEQARRDVARRCARLRLVLAEAAVLVGEPWRAVTAAQEVLDADPYDEAALRALMRAHAAAGRPAAALAAFAGLRERLAGDLGADPAAETAELHARILRGDLPGHPVRPAPAGRTVELARLAGLLDEVTAGANHAVAIRGEPGIGKTALLDAFVADARTSACVVHGRCDALGRELPLQPLLDGLEMLLRHADPDRAAAVLAEDAALVEPLLGDRHVPAPATVPVPADPDEARARLFAALLRVLRRAAGPRALVVAVDDLHLAGASTSEWLRFAARRGDRTLVVVTARPGPTPLPAAAQLELGPLDLAAAAELVGPARSARLWARSGGNPLLLRALAAGEEDAPLPATVRDAVEPVLAALGPADRTVRAAAVLGPDVDPELLAGVLELPVTAVLDDLDVGRRLRLLDERHGELRFVHELVREAAAAGAGAARGAHLHRRAAQVLAARPRTDPLTVAWHARLGGDAVLAAAELVRAARLAVDRGDLTAAGELADQAARLDPGPATHLARTDVALRRGDLPAAEAAVEVALAAGAGAEGYELAGWIAYYRRDHVRALRLATLGADRTGNREARAACAALAGRTRHSRGELDAAEELLTAAVTGSPGGMQRVWLAGLRVHQGRPGEALELTDAALTDPSRIRHPFAVGHGRFARVYALGMLGRPAEALAALDAAARAPDAEGPPGRRIEAVLHNMTGWVLRGLGRLDEAEERHQRALTWDGFPGLAEPHAQAGLDLVEVALLRGDVDGAAERLATTRLQAEGDGTMVWHQRGRHAVLTARIALAHGRFDDAAGALVTPGTGRSPGTSARHALLGRLLLACARAGRGDPVDRAEVEAALDGLAQVAGLEAWRYSAMAARYLHVPRWAARSERQLAVLADRAGEQGGDLRRLASA